MRPRICASHLNRRNLFLNIHIVFIFLYFNFALVYRANHSCGQSGQHIAILNSTLVSIDATICSHCAFHKRIDCIDTEIVTRHNRRIHEILLQPILNADPSEILIVQSFQIVLSLAFRLHIIIQFDGHQINNPAFDRITMAKSLMN